VESWVTRKYFKNLKFEKFQIITITYRP
jgi:hypothetical protein